MLNAGVVKTPPLFILSFVVWSCAVKSQSTPPTGDASVSHVGNCVLGVAFCHSLDIASFAMSWYVVMVVVNVVKVGLSKLCDEYPCHSGFRGRLRNSVVVKIVVPVVEFCGLIAHGKSRHPVNSAILP